MESNVTQVNIQLSNNTYLENYSIPPEKSVEQVLQDLQDSLSIPRFIENNQFIVALVHKGFILPPEKTFAEMGIKDGSFLKIKKITKTKIKESDYLVPRSVKTTLLPELATGDLLEIPPQPSEVTDFPIIPAETPEAFLASALEHTQEPVVKTNVDPEIPKTVETKNISPAQAPPKKKGFFKKFAIVLTVLASILVLSLVFTGFLLFKFGYASKLNLPFNVDVNSNINTNANTNTNTNANVDANAGTNADTKTDAKTETNANTRSETNSETNTNANADVNTGTNTNAGVNANTTSNTETNANADTNVGGPLKTN